jgi:hypothetical protein
MANKKYNKKKKANKVARHQAQVQGLGKTFATLPTYSNIDKLNEEPVSPRGIPTFFMLGNPSGLSSMVNLGLQGNIDMRGLNIPAPSADVELGYQGDKLGNVGFGFNTANLSPRLSYSRGPFRMGASYMPGQGANIYESYGPVSSNFNTANLSGSLNYAIPGGQVSIAAGKDQGVRIGANINPYFMKKRNVTPKEFKKGGTARHQSRSDMGTLSRLFEPSSSSSSSSSSPASNFDLGLNDYSSFDPMEGLYAPVDNTYVNPTWTQPWQKPKQYVYFDDNNRLAASRAEIDAMNATAANYNTQSTPAAETTTTSAETTTTSAETTPAASTSSSSGSSRSSGRETVSAYFKRNGINLREIPGYDGTAAGNLELRRRHMAGEDLFATAEEDQEGSTGIGREVSVEEARGDNDQLITASEQNEVDDLLTEDVEKEEDLTQSEEEEVNLLLNPNNDYYTNWKSIRKNTGIKPKKLMKWFKRNYGYVPRSLDVQGTRAGAPGFFGALMGTPTADPANAAYYQGLTGKKGFGIGAALAGLQNIGQGFGTFAAQTGAATDQALQQAGTDMVSTPNVMFMPERRARRFRRLGGEEFTGRPLYNVFDYSREQQAAANQAAAEAGQSGSSGTASNSAAVPAAPRQTPEAYSGGPILDTTPQTQDRELDLSQVPASAGPNFADMSRADLNEYARNQGFRNVRDMVRKTTIPQGEGLTTLDRYAKDVRQDQRSAGETLTPKEQLYLQKLSEMTSPVPPAFQRTANNNANQRTMSGMMEGQQNISPSQIPSVQQSGGMFVSDFMNSAMSAAQNFNRFAGGGTKRHQEFVDMSNLFPSDNTRTVANTLLTPENIEAAGRRESNEDARRRMVYEGRSENPSDFYDFVEEDAVIFKGENNDLMGAFGRDSEAFAQAEGFMNMFYDSPAYQQMLQGSASTPEEARLIQDARDKRLRDVQGYYYESSYDPIYYYPVQVATPKSDLDKDVLVFQGPDAREMRTAPETVIKGLSRSSDDIGQLIPESDIKLMNQLSKEESVDKIDASNVRSDLNALRYQLIMDDTKIDALGNTSYQDNTGVMSGDYSGLSQAIKNLTGDGTLQKMGKDIYGKEIDTRPLQRLLNQFGEDGLKQLLQEVSQAETQEPMNFAKDGKIIRNRDNAMAQAMNYFNKQGSKDAVNEAALNAALGLYPDVSNGGVVRNQEAKEVPDTEVLGDDMSVENAMKRLYYDYLAGEGAQSNRAGQLLRLNPIPMFANTLAERITMLGYPFMDDKSQQQVLDQYQKHIDASEDLEDYKQYLKDQGKYKTPWQTIKGVIGLEQKGGYSRNQDTKGVIGASSGYDRDLGINPRRVEGITYDSSTGQPILPGTNPNAMTVNLPEGMASATTFNPFSQEYKTLMQEVNATKEAAMDQDAIDYFNQAGGTKGGGFSFTGENTGEVKKDADGKSYVKITEDTSGGLKAGDIIYIGDSKQTDGYLVDDDYMASKVSGRGVYKISGVKRNQSAGTVFNRLLTGAKEGVGQAVDAFGNYFDEYGKEVGNFVGAAGNYFDEAGNLVLEGGKLILTPTDQMTEQGQVFQDAAGNYFDEYGNLIKQGVSLYTYPHRAAYNQFVKRNQEGKMKPYSEYTGSLSKEAYEARGKAMGNPNVIRGREGFTKLPFVGKPHADFQTATDPLNPLNQAIIGELAREYNIQSNRESNFQNSPIFRGLDGNMTNMYMGHTPGPTAGEMLLTPQENNYLYNRTV